MAVLITATPPAPIRALSRDALASILDQSVDCVKLVGLDGRVEYMNYNGLCAMEIDDVSALLGEAWDRLWPEEARGSVLDACAAAGGGQTSRFSAYCPTAKGTPKWWDVSVSPVRGESGDITGVLSISRDITETELSRQALEVTSAEMVHRLKNSYAMVGSLLSGLARGDPDREIFAREMVERLSALAASQTLLGGPSHQPANLAELIPVLVKPFDTPACPIRIDPLPDVAIARDRADAIALVIGELAVNSAKHGALGGEGHVGIRAETGDGRLIVHWSERSSRTVTARTRDGGQGLTLMNRIVRARRGALDIDWRPNGLDATLIFAAA